MKDIHEERSELLESIARSNETVSAMLDGANLVMSAGTQGIIDTVNIDGGPELILTVIDSLTKLVARQQQTVCKLNEMWLSSLDHSENIVNIITKFTGE